MPESPEFLALEKTLSDDYKQIMEDLEDRSKFLCTELEERLIILTASLKTLKESVSRERELWRNEVKQTIELEKTLSNTHLNSGDYSHQFEILTDAFLKSQQKIRNELTSNVYKQQLLEAENMCNLEMLKIKNSLECLAPLQAIVDEWSSESEEAKAEI